MGFRKKFGLIAPWVLAIPFIIIVLLIKSGAKDCTNGISDNLAGAVAGDMESLEKAQNKYCDTKKGKFAYADAFSDWVVKIYEVYIWVGLILSIVLAGLWEVYERGVA